MLKIILSGRGLALTVQLFGRTASGCGLRAETLALLALGILALEESLAGGLVRLGGGEGIYGNGVCFLRFVVVEIDLDLTVLELSARKSDIDLLTVSFLLSSLEILLLGEEHGHMAGDAVLIAEIDAVCDRTRHEAAICQIHLTIVLLDGLEFDLVVEELEVRPGRLFLDIGVAKQPRFNLGSCKQESPVFYGGTECKDRFKPVVWLVHIVHLKQFRP